MNKKAHKTTFLTLVIVVVAFILAVHFSLPFFLSRSITDALGEGSSVGSVQIRFNKIVVNDIKVQNPPLSRLKYAIKIDKLTVNAPLREYLQPKVDIRQILLDKIYMSVEFYTKNRKEGNWNSILKNVNKPIADAKPGEDRPGDRRQIMIKNLTLRDIQVELLFAGGKPQMLPILKNISINNIDPENGLLTKRLTRIITNHVIQSVSRGVGIQGITGIILSAPAAAVETIFFPFKLFGRGKQKNSSKQKSDH